MSLPEASVRGQPEGRVLVEHLAVQVHADVSLHVLGTVIEHLQRKGGPRYRAELIWKMLKFWGGLGLVKKVKDRFSCLGQSPESTYFYLCALCFFSMILLSNL